jgi:hypothetical protein
MVTEFIYSIKFILYHGPQRPNTDGLGSPKWRTVFKIRSIPTRECDLLKPCDMAALRSL